IPPRNLDTMQGNFLINQIQQPRQISSPKRHCCENNSTGPCKRESRNSIWHEINGDTIRMILGWNSDNPYLPDIIPRQRLDNFTKETTTDEFIAYLYITITSNK